MSTELSIGDLTFDPTKGHWQATPPRRPSHPARVVFDAYRDAAGEWRWRAWARNGKIIADSGESYKRRGDCLRMADLLRATHVVGMPKYPLFVEGVLQ